MSEAILTERDELEAALTKGKTCGRCKRHKSADEFTADKTQPDGLCFYCRECKNDYKRGLLDSRNLNRKTITGLDSISQIESVVRTMAELQYHINEENKLLKKRLSKIKKESRELLDPFITRQIFLQYLVRRFLKKHYPEKKNYIVGCRFGAVRSWRGVITVILKPNLAGPMIGKP